MIGLTNCIYLLAIFLASPWLAWRWLRTNRYREGWLEKLFGHVPRSEANSRLIWLHGVSVGEVQLLQPLAERIRRQYPGYQFAISTTTRTGMQLARKLFPSDVVFYMPIDFSWAMTSAMERLRPQMIVLGELELWPNLIQLATLRSVPIAVVNGRLSRKSFRGYARLGRWMRPIFRGISAIGAQDRVYAERFIALGVPIERVHLTGSMKYDNAAGERDGEPVRNLAALVGLTTEHRVFLAGSTQDPEERYAAEAYAASRVKCPTLRLIVAPRHPERFDEVFETLHKTGLRIVRRTKIENSISANSWDILLVDTVGELRWWWGLSEFALVGGSFGARGGQNMIEPAAYGCSLAFGPNTWNFREAVGNLLKCDAAVELSGLDELLPWLDEQLDNPRIGMERGQRARAVVFEHHGATDRTLSMLCDLLPSHIENPTFTTLQSRKSAA